MEMFASYVECALWSSSDEDGESLDSQGYTIDDIAQGARETMIQECADFVTCCERDCPDVSEINPAQMGFDFWLTRNRHGAGFWDRGLGDLGDRLTEIAHSFGSSDLYVGDDGLLYVS